MDEVDLEKSIAGINKPALFISSADDKLVDTHHVLKLF